MTRRLVGPGKLPTAEFRDPLNMSDFRGGPVVDIAALLKVYKDNCLRAVRV